MKKIKSDTLATFLGFIGGLVEVLTPVINSGNFDLNRDWMYLLKAAGIFTFGYITNKIIKNEKTDSLPGDDSKEN